MSPTPRQCAAPDCPRVNVIARGLCWAHYQKARREAGYKSPPRGPCSFPGCPNGASTSRTRLCTTHVRRWETHGSFDPRPRGGKRPVDPPPPEVPTTARARARKAQRPIHPRGTPAGP